MPFSQALQEELDFLVDVASCEDEPPVDLSNHLDLYRCLREIEDNESTSRGMRNEVRGWMIEHGYDRPRNPNAVYLGGFRGYTLRGKQYEFDHHPAGYHGATE